MKKDTLLVHSGRKPKDNFGIVNPPVYHASTITFPTVAKYNEKPDVPFDGVQYGRTGTPTTFALEDSICSLYGGYKTIATSSGAAAIAIAMSALLKNGDHAIVIDNVYGPTRTRVSDDLMARAGVDISYFDPFQSIKDLIQPETKVVYIEVPGSLTFEMIDIKAVVKEAHAAGALVIMDNTWATGLFFQPFEHGVDIIVEAGTKYIGGHADIMLGLITVKTPSQHLAIKSTANAMGNCPGPDDCYLGLRGFRTLSVRMERHQKNAIQVAKWLKEREEVSRVLYPALPDDQGYKIWKRDFKGACGLFGIILNYFPEKAIAAMLDNMKFFAMGASWGGYESLIIPTEPSKIRSASIWSSPGQCLRLHIGLEDPSDLISDLEEGLRRLTST
jgi:cystathionine beta-lyase